MQRLVADGVKPGTEAAAERKVVTALFADLVGYTATSERLEPADLVRVLNGYFQRMSDAIHDHRGHVSTFLGDGILAYFEIHASNIHAASFKLCTPSPMTAIQNHPALNLRATLNST